MVFKAGEIQVQSQTRSPLFAQLGLLCSGSKDHNHKRPAKCLLLCDTAWTALAVALMCYYILSFDLTT